jgi:hypothetical protein
MRKSTESMHSVSRGHNCDPCSEGVRESKAGKWIKKDVA